MYEYFVLLETLYCDHLNRRVEQKLYRWERQFVGWSPEELGLLRQARQLLQKAKTAAAGDTLALKRIELFDKTFRLTEYLVEVGNAETVAEAQIAEIRDYVADVLAPDLMTIARRGDEKAAIQLVDQALDRMTKGK
jgi:hypothetical protein